MTFSDWSDWFNLDDEEEEEEAKGWTYLGLGIAFDQDKVPGHTLKIWIVPYSLIVVPLLLRSAGLMFSRRRLNAR